MLYQAHYYQNLMQNLKMLSTNSIQYNKGMNLLIDVLQEMTIQMF
jgi:hypothetical protein